MILKRKPTTIYFIKCQLNYKVRENKEDKKNEAIKNAGRGIGGIKIKMII
jgi:hypothetical protein